MSARILVIEDNPLNMELMVFLLKSFGHSPICAYDGEEGLALADKHHPDLIVCDIHIPKIDGYGVLERLKGGQPVIAVTALAMVGDKERLLQAGFNGYISKPIDPETFVEQLDRFLPVPLRSSRPPVENTPTPPATQVRAAAAGILVVDDSPINSELIKNTLVPFGYAVDIADGTHAALEKLRTGTFDLILSDLHMPINDGISLLRAVKADPVHAATPFVFISASYENDADQALALALGARRFLCRPIEPDALLAELAACLPVRAEPPK